MTLMSVNSDQIVAEPNGDYTGWLHLGIKNTTNKTAIKKNKHKPTQRKTTTWKKQKKQHKPKENNKNT